MSFFMPMYIIIIFRKAKCTHSTRNLIKALHDINIIIFVVSYVPYIISKEMAAYVVEKLHMSNKKMIFYVSLTLFSQTHEIT